VNRNQILLLTEDGKEDPIKNIKNKLRKGEGKRESTVKIMEKNSREVFLD